MNSNWITFVLCAWSAVAASASEPLATDRSGAVNAAPIYWQAFAAVPAFTPEEQKRIDDAVHSGGKVSDDDVSPLVDRCAAALKQMRRASRARVCNWELDYDEGPNMLMPHLGKGRELAQIALLRARLRLQKGDAGGAAGDALATLRMARHLANSTPLIAFLVGNAVERDSIGLLAESLPAHDRATLDRLGETLAALPTVPSLSDCLAAERATKLAWLDLAVESQDSGNKLKVAGPLLSVLSLDDDQSKHMRAQFESLNKPELKAAVARFGKDCAELQRIIELPAYADRQEKAGRFLDDLSKSATGQTAADRERLFSTWALPVYRRMIDVDEQRRVRLELLSLAVLVQAQGPDAVKSAKQLDKDKIEYRRTAKGFELRYKLAPGVKAEVLTAGPAEK